MTPVRVNGESREVCAETVADLLEELGYADFERGGIAVAVNRTCILRRAFAEAPVAAGDEIEILAPMAGG